MPYEGVKVLLYPEHADRTKPEQVRSDEGVRAVELVARSFALHP